LIPKNCNACNTGRAVDKLLATTPAAWCEETDSPSGGQRRRPAAAASGGGQRRQPAAATSGGNQRRQPAAADKAGSKWRRRADSV